MAPKPKRYKLILYQHLMKRWYGATFFLGLVLVAFGVYVYFFVEDIRLSDTGSFTLWGLGAFSIIIALILFLLRSGSFVRLFPTYLQIVTPFMRVKVPYKSINRTQTMEFRNTLAKKKIKGQQADIVVPFTNKTVIIVSLAKFPIWAGFLRTFMSPFFFMDKTPHFVLLLDDWLGFSTELESLRAGAKQYAPPQVQSFISQEVSNQKARPGQAKPRSGPPPQKRSSSSILSSLKDNDKK